jgi:alpha-L-fucosidase
MPSAVDWHSTREVLGMLRQVAGGFGNLLLNVGPAPDGSVPPEAVERLRPVGEWLKASGEAVYGITDRTDGRLEWMPCGQWTAKGRNSYWWVNRWPGRELVVGGLKTRVVRASFLATGEPIRFEQSGSRLILRDLPAASPDPVAGVTVIKLECRSRPRQELGAGCVVLKKK